MNSMTPEDIESEEVDVEPFEGDPDFEDSPTKQHYLNVQDDEVDLPPEVTNA